MAQRGDGRRKPVLKHGVIVRIETGNLCGFGSREVMMIRKVGRKNPPRWRCVS